MNGLNPNYDDIIPFTDNEARPLYMRGYGFRVKLRAHTGRVLEIDVFSNRTNPAWAKLVPDADGGYTLGGTYYSKASLLSMAQTRLNQIAWSVATQGATSAATAKNTLAYQAIIFSESKGVSQMFKAGTTLDEVVAVLEKRSIEIDSSFKVFYPKTGLVKNLVAVPQKVVLRFE